MVFLSLAAVTVIPTADVHFVLQGIIWLVIGTAAELTPVVSLACFSHVSFALMTPFIMQLFISLYLNGSFSSP